MKIRLLTVLLALFTINSNLTYSQETRSLDSLSNSAYANSWVFKKIYDMATSNPVWIQKAIKNDYNRLDVIAAYNTGKWIPAQDATKVRGLTLNTEGKTNWNNFQLWGKFRYTRQLEDSTRLRHQTRINQDAPFYFGSLRKNYYERDVYKLDAAIQYGFLNEKLPVTLGLDYHIGNHFSNNDPRGRVQDFQFNTSLGIGKVFYNWSIHVLGMYGYGREQVGLGYKNEQYTGNTANPLYVNWEMNGFGNASERLTEMTYNNDMDRYGLGLHYHQTLNQHNILFANINLVHEQQFFKRFNSSPQTYLELNKYNRQTYSFDFLWHKKSIFEKNSVYKLKIGIVDGRDFNYIVQSNNYVFRQEQIETDAIFTGTKTQYAVHINYKSTSSEDGLTSNKLTYQDISPKISISRFIQTHHKAQFIPSIQIGYRHVIDHEFNLSTMNSSIFAQTILYHDMLYSTTSSITVGTTLQYLFRTDHKIHWKAAFGIDYTQPRELHEYTYDIPSFPNDNRFNSKLNLTLFF